MKRMNQLVLAMAAVAGFAQLASAAPMFPGTTGLYLYDPNTDTGVSVGMSGTSAIYSGSVGAYYVVTSATGFEAPGNTVQNPNLDLNIANVTAGSGATLPLEIFFSDGVFGPTVSGYTLSTGGPLGGGSVSTYAYLGASPFSQTSSLGGSADVFPFTINATGTIGANNYYLTIEDTISGNAASLDSNLQVAPDGGTTAMLLGSALTGIALLRKKLKA